MACGLPELHHLGLFKNKNQLKYTISYRGLRLPSAPIQIGTNALVDFIPVCRFERSGDCFILFILIVLSYVFCDFLFTF